MRRLGRPPIDGSLLIKQAGKFFQLYGYYSVSSYFVVDGAQKLIGNFACLILLFTIMAIAILPSPTLSQKSGFEQPNI